MGGVVLLVLLVLGIIMLVVVVVVCRRRRSEDHAYLKPGKDKHLDMYCVYGGSGCKWAIRLEIYIQFECLCVYVCISCMLCSIFICISFVCLSFSGLF